MSYLVAESLQGKGGTRDRASIAACALNLNVSSGIDLQVALEGSLAGLAPHLVPARALEARDKRPRLGTGIGALDALLEGGWARGALNELSGERGQGRTAIVAATLAATLRRGEAAALIDFGGTFDPWSACRIGLPLERLLWVRAQGQQPLLVAAEAVALAGGFSLVVLDFNERSPAIPTAAWLRLRRVAGNAAVLVVGRRPQQGLLGAASVVLERAQVRFWGVHTPTARLLRGIEIRASLTRHPGQTCPAGARALDLRLLRNPAAGIEPTR